MSISDLIVVMKDGMIQQIDEPQNVYDDPVNLFVAKFLGTPAINVFEGEVKDGWLVIGGEAVMEVPGVPEQAVFVGIRPEGMEPDPNGAFRCGLVNVEVMGRDTSVVFTHDGAVSENLRAIVGSGKRPAKTETRVAFRLDPLKVHLFDRETEERIRFEV